MALRLQRGSEKAEMRSLIARITESDGCDRGLSSAERLFAYSALMPAKKLALGAVRSPVPDSAATTTTATEHLE